jgi:tetratricopeptide (TPR) repeat protein
MSKRKAIIYLVLSIAIVVSATVGCSEGGGSGGRQILPGENPFGPSYSQPGAGTGTGTGTSTGTGTGTDTGTGTEQSPAEMITTGYAKIAEGNYPSAISAFTKTIHNNQATPAEKQEAYSGRGWTKSKSPVNEGGGTLAGLSDLQEASTMNPGVTSNPLVTSEARLGYAISLVYKVVEGKDPSNNVDNLQVAINILENLLLQSPWVGQVVRAEYKDLFVSSAEARAMLALAYDLSGNTSAADSHIAKAIAEEPNNQNIIDAKNTINMLRGSL